MQHLQKNTAYPMSRLPMRRPGFSSYVPNDPKYAGALAPTVSRRVWYRKANQAQCSAFERLGAAVDWVLENLFGL